MGAEQLVAEAQALLDAGRLDDARVVVQACLRQHMGYGPALDLLDAIDEAEEQPEVVLDEFDVVDLLGEGGMGTVKRVRSRTTGEDFAMKAIRADLLDDPAARQRFLHELQVWTELPRHPHLVECGFFRTLPDGSVAIFAELVTGGSLQRTPPLPEPVALDLCIQLAWALGALHRRGLVHRDVKPGNVLVTQDGVARLTDFGLTAAAGGSTPAFASPEQARGGEVTSASDVWSLGLTLLALLGGRSWTMGPTAASVLETCKVSEPVRHVLSRCFAPEPAARIEAEDVAVALADAYARSGQVYRRSRPEDDEADVDVAEDGHGPDGATWSDPRVWLEHALRSIGRDPTGLVATLPPRTGSRRAQAISDLAAFEQAEAVLAAVEWDGGSARAVLARLLTERAMVHRSLHDEPGAVVLLDRAIALVRQELRADGILYDADLARPLITKALARRAAGDLDACIALYDEAIAAYDARIRPVSEADTRMGLSITRMNLAVAQRNAGRPAEALQTYQQAYADAEAGGGDPMMLAALRMNEGNAHADLGDLPTARLRYADAIGLYGEPADATNASSLARTWICEGTAANLLGEVDAADAGYNAAATLLERLVQSEGRAIFGHELAMVRSMQASVRMQRGDEEGARGCWLEAIETYEHMVQVQGRRDLAQSLAETRLNYADLLVEDEPQEAWQLAQAALDVLDRLPSAPARVRALGLYRRAASACNLGLLHQARQDLEMARQLTPDRGDRLDQVEIYVLCRELSARLAEHDGRHDEAVQLARAGAEAWADIDEVHRPPSAARAIELYEALS